MSQSMQTNRSPLAARRSTLLPLGTSLLLMLAAHAPSASAEPQSAPEPRPAAAAASPGTTAGSGDATSSATKGDKAQAEVKQGGTEQSDQGRTQAGQSQAGQSQQADDPRRALAQDREAFFDAHLAALHAGLMLTDDQQGLWPPVESAIRALSKTRHPRRTREDIAKLLDEAPSDLLRMRGEQLKQRGDAIQKLAEATAPLLDKLDDAQKARLPLLLEGMRPGPILRAAFDIRGGRVVEDTDDAQRAGRNGDASGGDGDEGFDRRPDGGMRDDGYRRQGYGDDMPMHRQLDRFGMDDDDRN